ELLHFSLCFLTSPRLPSSTLFPYTTLFRSQTVHLIADRVGGTAIAVTPQVPVLEDEVRDHPVPSQGCAFVVAGSDQLEEVRDRERRFHGRQLEHDGAPLRDDSDSRPGAGKPGHDE